MAQQLILPINEARITASYKNSNYKKQFGYTHYGIDMTDKNRRTFTVWGSGIGEVIETGWSDSGGNVIVVIYRECLLTDGTVKDLTFRYYHLSNIYVKKGQKITKDTKLGLYGNTGYSSGAHLHLEADTDAREKYACYTPQISKNSGVLKRGTDSTIDPIRCLYVKSSSPDWQSVHSSGFNTVNNNGISFPKY